MFPSEGELIVDIWIGQEGKALRNKQAEVIEGAVDIPARLANI
jgi:hypothetical protein